MITELERGIPFTLTLCLQAMSMWAGEEDGLPADGIGAFQAYVKGCRLMRDTASDMESRAFWRSRVKSLRQHTSSTDWEQWVGHDEEDNK